MAKLRGTGAEMCRVRTMGGDWRSRQTAMAASQLSVELCVFTTSKRRLRSSPVMPCSPSTDFLAMGMSTASRP